MQNDLAWQIVSDKTIEKPDLELAETIANRANEAARGKDPDILDTQARVLFMKGQKEEAVQAQTKAVALAEPDQKQAMQSRLDSYQKGELPPVIERAALFPKPPPCLTVRFLWNLLECGPGSATLTRCFMKP